MQRWDGTNWAKVSGPLMPLADRIDPLLDAAAKDYVEKNAGWPKRSETCDAS